MVSEKYSYVIDLNDLISCKQFINKFTSNELTWYQELDLVKSVGFKLNQVTYINTRLPADEKAKFNSMLKKLYKYNQKTAVY